MAGGEKLSVAPVPGSSRTTTKQPGFVAIVVGTSSLIPGSAPRCAALKGAIPSRTATAAAVSTRVRRPFGGGARSSDVKVALPCAARMQSQWSPWHYAKCVCIHTPLRGAPPCPTVITTSSFRHRSLARGMPGATVCSVAAVVWAWLS